MALEDIKDDCPRLYQIGLFYSIFDCKELFKTIYNNKDMNSKFLTYKRISLRRELTTLQSLLLSEKFSNL